MISEYFIGHQGEGSTQGRLSAFIRFYGCNLRCDFCDTVFSREEEVGHSIDDVLHYLRANKGKYYSVIFTGGEPFLKQGAIITIVQTCVEEGLCHTFEIETNGTLKMNDIVLIIKNPTRQRIFFTISPKCLTGQQNTYPLLLNQLKAFDCHNYITKWVFRDNNDLEKINSFCKRFFVSPGRVYVQPQGITLKLILYRLKTNYSFIYKYGFNISLRQHIIFLLRN